MTLIGWVLAALGGLGVLTVFLLYPMLVRLSTRTGRATRPGMATRADQAPQPDGTETTHVPVLPTVSVIVAARNAAALVGAKVENLRALDYPPENLQVVFCSDGSTDDSVHIAEQAVWPALTVLRLADHQGKHVALNRAVEAATGDVLVFTDVDALLEPLAVRRLVKAFQDPSVGGVSGRRMIGEPESFLAGAQATYVALDSGLKALESRRGSVTSNDGKLYAIRRELFRQVPGGVTDDLFQCLAIVDQGARFVYTGEARAWIRTPSRNGAHEVSRRRRIVCRSLRGIAATRRVLDPRRTGLFAFGLATNKVGRRLLPVFQLAILLGTTLAAADSRVAQVALAAQLVFYTLAAARPACARWPLPRAIHRVWDIAHYFVLGSYGTLLGLGDFLRGHEVDKWDPIKQG